MTMKGKNIKNKTNNNSKNNIDLPLWSLSEFPPLPSKNNNNNNNNNTNDNNNNNQGVARSNPTGRRAAVAESSSSEGTTGRAAKPAPAPVPALKSVGVESNGGGGGGGQENIMAPARQMNIFLAGVERSLWSTPAAFACYAKSGDNNVGMDFSEVDWKEEMKKKNQEEQEFRAKMETAKKKTKEAIEVAEKFISSPLNEFGRQYRALCENPRVSAKERCEKICELMHDTVVAYQKQDEEESGDNNNNNNNNNNNVGMDFSEADGEEFPDFEALGREFEIADKNCTIAFYQAMKKRKEQIEVMEQFKSSPLYDFIQQYRALCQNPRVSEKERCEKFCELMHDCVVAHTANQKQDEEESVGGWLLADD